MTCSTLCFELYPREYSHHTNHYPQNLLSCLFQSEAPKHSPVFWLEVTGMEMNLLGTQAQRHMQLFLLIRASFEKQKFKVPQSPLGKNFGIRVLNSN